MSDPSPPEKSPLSADDADRLSERFTASWDAGDSETANSPLPESPLPFPSHPPVPGGESARADDHRPLTPQRSIHFGKQTLMGLPAPLRQADAPRSSAPPSLAVSELTPFGPPVALASPFDDAAPVGSPSRLGSTPPLGSPKTAFRTNEGPSSSPPASERSSPNAAHGPTTPAKRYVPKDDPSTPAVVIADASQGRAASTLSAAGLAPTAALRVLPETAKANRDFVVGADELRLRRRRVPPSLILAGIGLLVAAAIVIGLRSTDSTVPSAAPEASVTRAVVPAAEPVQPAPPTPVAVEPSAPPADDAKPAAPANDVKPAKPPVSTPTATAPVVKAERVTRPAADLARNVKRPAAPAKSRPEARSPGSLPQAEPAAAAPKGKTVIVRETPF